MEFLIYSAYAVLGAAQRDSVGKAGWGRTFSDDFRTYGWVTEGQAR